MPVCLFNLYNNILIFSNFCYTLHFIGRIANPKFLVPVFNIFISIGVGLIFCGLSDILLCNVVVMDTQFEWFNDKKSAVSWIDIVTET